MNTAVSLSIASWLAATKSGFDASTRTRIAHHFKLLPDQLTLYDLHCEPIAVMAISSRDFA